MSEINQLLLKFDHKTNFNEHDFYISKSNSNAFDLINRWPDWDKRILNISLKIYWYIVTFKNTM